MSRYNNNSYSVYINNVGGDSTRALDRRIEDEEGGNNLVGSSVNKVDRVHWYIKGNARQHNCIKFDQIHDQNKPTPVLRRGQIFYVAIRFKDRDFDIKTDRIVLNFNFGARPAVNKGTMAVLIVEYTKFDGPKDDWACQIDHKTSGQDLVLQIYIPATVPVGKWNLVVRSGLKEHTDRNAMAVYKDTSDVFILFNPWCKEDSVFMEEETMREEYVLNEKGKVYVGAYKRPRGRSWAFGQFDDVVLPVACYILALHKLPFNQWGNPVQVVRTISAGVNDCDVGGILSGKWDGEYGDGVAPYKWTGSVRVLEQYIKNGYNPVKYGQCWVFSAITTTICRALGIPCRSVTNYVSAHDTNSSLTIDKFFNSHGDEIDGGPDGENEDSIWNFHVWNDVWMERPDLPKGYGGWQAIDATPQEMSDRKYQCGPASLEAIRRGDVGLAYDGPFVFAEVNADIMHWGEDPKSAWGYSRMKINKFHIGRSVMTKIPNKEDDFGEVDREDIVEVYKNKEGSAMERLAIHNAIRGSKRAQFYYGEKSDDVTDVAFDLIDIDSISVGDPFKVKVVIRNESDEKRTISAALTARSIYYTGIHYSLLKKAEGKVVIGPKEERDVTLDVSFKEYWAKLQEHCMIKMYVICRVQETGQTWTDEDDFEVEKPPLTIQLPAEAKKGEACDATFTFKNPLDAELTQCSLSVDGAGLMRPKAIDIPHNVAAGGDFNYTFSFRPRVQGSRKLIGSFSSKELYDINGTKTMKVLK